MTVTRKWSLLAAVLVVAIFAGGWFLLIAPKRAEATKLEGKTVSQEDANARLRQQIQVLQAQMEDLPTQRARLASIKKQLPDNPALPTLIRNLTSAGRDVGASVDALTPALPEAVVQALAPVAVATPAPEAGSDTAETTESTGSGTADTTSTGTTTTAAVAAPPAAVLYQVPLTVKVTGSYFELEQFVNKLEGLRRSFLVTGFTLGEPTDSVVAEGDLEIALTGRVFLTQPGTATTTPAPVASTPVAE
jgi:Tfp pilus assembly protein PilO